VKGKTPLVLPYEGERRKGRCFAQPPEPGPLPRRERQRGSCLGGRGSSSRERQTGSCGAKNVSVKGPQAASSMQGDSGLAPSLPGCPRSARHQHEAAPTRSLAHPHERFPRYAAADDPTADPSNCGSLRSAPAATGASPTCATPSRLCSPGRKRLHRVHPPGRREAAFCAAPRKAREAGRGWDEAANPGRVLFRAYVSAGCSICNRIGKNFSNRFRSQHGVIRERCVSGLYVSLCRFGVSVVDVWRQDVT